MDAHEIRQLEEAYEKVWEIALRLGLDPYPTHFEVVPAQIMYEFGAYGLPGRFSHWTHGKAYHQMKTMYDYGLSKIYELVINTNPCQAFLMENNDVIQNVMVMAHVLGHCDFFKHNLWYRNTNRQMTDAVGMNAERIRRYEFEHGAAEVEQFLDAVLSIQEHIDPNLDLRPRADAKPARSGEPERPTTPYDDLWRSDETDEKAEPRSGLAHEEKDLLWYLANHAPTLEDWQRDILFIVRNEMLYFTPQMQTKVMNEGWACATGDSLLVTERGLLRFDELYAEREAIRVASGAPGALHPITAFHKEPQVQTIRIATRRGYALEGALQHRVLLDNGSWAYLRDIRPGQRVQLSCRTGIWPDEPVSLSYLPPLADTRFSEGTQQTGVSLSMGPGGCAGRQTGAAAVLDRVTSESQYAVGHTAEAMPTRRTLSLPAILDESLAYLIGCFAGEGNTTESGLCLTCGDSDHAARLAEQCPVVFGVSCTLHDEPAATGRRWRVEIHSRELVRLLDAVGIDVSASASQKQAPRAILRSPFPVVSAFLRGYFDAASYVDRDGVILSCASPELARTTQLLLLNFGIMSTQHDQADGGTQIQIAGASALRFQERIGFGMPRQRRALEQYITVHRRSRQESGIDEEESGIDEVVSVESGIADVYDITVDTAHSYVANGMVSHNSFWHLRIMREMDLSTSDYIEFASLHSGVLSPAPRRINPYYVGLKIFEDIERRWDTPSEDDTREFKRPGGQGREKIFEVRELDSDVSFLRNYLTKELVEDLDLYIYENRDDEWVIVEKDWRKVRDILVHSMTNFGHPYITVQDGDYRGNRELLLRHHFEGRELDLDYAEKTLRNLHRLWGRKVHLETSRSNGTRILLGYDGIDNTTTVL